jgi:thiol:disulfide interchange protein
MEEEKLLYDPMQDPRRQLQRAIERARRENKNILVEAGADWCVWCHRLEQFIASHAELHQLRSQHYVHIRLFSGEGEGLPLYFDNLPALDGLPHYFVYNKDGKLLHSQDTEPFESGETYNFDKVWEFLAYWAIDPSVH